MPLRHATAADDGNSTRSRPHPYRVFAFAYCVLFILTGAWSLATPLFASPDEPVQVIKAVAVAHGEFLGQSATEAVSPHVFVTVPASFVSGVHLPGCYVGRPEMTPECSPMLSNASEPLRVSIYVGRYPPLYYAIVGVPSWFSDSSGAVYAMRLVSASLSSLFLALAITAALRWSKRRIAVVGVLVAITSQVLFIGAVVNPNSLEVSSAIALWTSVLLLALGDEEVVPKGLLAIFGASAATEVLCRALSPLWVAIALVVGVLLANRRRLGALASSRTARFVGALVAIATLLALLWTTHFHATAVQGVQGAAAEAIKNGYARALLDRQELYLHESIGTFGVLSVPAPAVTYLFTEIAACALFVLALLRSRWRIRVVYLVAVVAAIGVPFVIVLSQANRLHGLIWQGRDGLPLTVAIPITAGVLLGSVPAKRRLDLWAGTGVTLLVALGATAGFAGALNRYVVGYSHPFAFFSGGSWQPPVGALTLLVVVAVVTTAGGGATIRALVADRDGPDPGSSGP